MSLADLPKQYDPQDAQRRWYDFWLEKGYFHADPSSAKPPYTIVIPPPNVTGALAPRARAEQHAPGHPDPLAADAGVRRPLDARHRPRRDRHPGGRRAAAARGGEEDPPRPRPRGARRADLGLEGRVREAHPQPAPPDGLLVRLGPHPVHARPGLRPGRPRRRSSASSRPTRSSAASGSSTGTPTSARPSPTTRSSTRTSRASSGRSSTPSTGSDPARRSTSPPPAPRRCSATPPSPSTPTTPATST